MTTSSQARSVVRFATFEVDLNAGELRQRGGRVRIQEQPFRLLVALLEQPGETISRDQLRERLWPSDTFVDFEHSRIERRRLANRQLEQSRAILIGVVQRPYLLQYDEWLSSRFRSVKYSHRVVPLTSQTWTPDQPVRFLIDTRSGAALIPVAYFALTSYLLLAPARMTGSSGMTVRYCQDEYKRLFYPFERM